MLSLYDESTHNGSIIHLPSLPCVNKLVVSNLASFTDKHLNLDTLLIQIGSHITSKWYQFVGAAE